MIEGAPIGRSPQNLRGEANPHFNRDAYAELHEVRNLFRPPDQILVRHNHAYAPARGYLAQHGAPKHELDDIFDQDGRWILQGSTFPSPYQMHPYQLDVNLKRILSPISAVGDYALDSTRTHGYNSHGVPHIDFVTKNALALAKELDLPMAIQQNLVIASRAHDLGNMLDREYHAILSPLILAHVQPGVLQDKSRWAEIRAAMNVHDSEIAEYKLRARGLVNAEDIMQFWKDNYGPTLLALRIADKTDVGRSRLSKKISSSAAVEEDIHTALNLTFETEYVQMDPEKQVLTWQLAFNTDITEDELGDLFPMTRQRSKHGGRQALVPSVASRAFDSGEATFFETLSGVFVDVYGARMRTFVLDGFALTDQIQAVRIQFKDRSGEYKFRENGPDKGLTFLRQGLDRDLARLAPRQTVKPVDTTSFQEASVVASVA